MERIKNNYYINGQNFVCELKDPFLDELIKTFLNKKMKSNSNIAVAVNNQLIERGKWKKKKIQFKDKIEIVSPFFGG